jgi:hypothetical protein
MEAAPLMPCSHGLPNVNFMFVIAGTSPALKRTISALPSDGQLRMTVFWMRCGQLRSRQGFNENDVGFEKFQAGALSLNSAKI